MEQPWLDIVRSGASDPARRITYFGVTDTRGKYVPFGIRQEDRSKHTYVIGKSGMGKSTLLENMAVQDIENGEGMCFIDPHGGTAEKLLQYVPEHRVRDVLYFAPFDLQYPISFNVLENVDGDKRHLVVAGLMSAFEKIWVDAWSARMAYILQNTIAALLEFPGATLLGVNRMYIDKEYRKNVIAHLTDPSVRSFWVDEFSKYTDRYAQEATPAIQNKIGQFASNALVRNVIGQETSSFNMRSIMDERKIFIVNLSKGRVGEGNANLLGSMLITKMYLAAMSRADVPLGEQRTLPPFYLYVDEFQNFANKSFAEILSEARKYKLALTIAHQYIEQMEEEVRAAVFGNVGTMITFRVGAYDAEVLEKEYAPTFEIDDIVNLGARQIYLKLMIDSVSSQPFSARTLPPIPEPAVDQTQRVIAFSRARYALPRSEVEKAIKDWSEKRYEDPEAESKMRAREERTQAQAEGRGVRPTGEAPAGSRAPSPNDREQRRTGPFRAGTAPRPLPPSSESTRPQERPRPQREFVRNDVDPKRGERFRAETSSAPRPTRSVSQRPVSRPEHANSDLRDTLSRLTANREGVSPVSRPVSEAAADRVVPPVREGRTAETQEHHAPTSDTVAVPNTSPAQKPAQPQRVLAPSRDDGKGVTDEGKAELRSLLASLAAQKHGARESVPDRVAPVSDPRIAVPPAVQHRPQGTERSRPEPQTRPTPVVLAPRPVPSQENPAPPSLPKQRLDALLHVDKPTL